jgi:hypothetical protein
METGELLVGRRGVVSALLELPKTAANEQRLHRSRTVRVLPEMVHN